MYLVKALPTLKNGFSQDEYRREKNQLRSFKKY